jgi:hypothetical protein
MNLHNGGAFILFRDHGSDHRGRHENEQKREQNHSISVFENLPIIKGRSGLDICLIATLHAKSELGGSGGAVIYIQKSTFAMKRHREGRNVQK